GAAREVVHHLIAQGHRDIAHLTEFEAGMSFQERTAGYRQALEEATIPFRPELVIASATDHQGRAGEHPDRIRRLLSLPDPPTALFAVNDRLALAVIDALHAMGWRVPQDIAVAGFGGSLLRESDRAFLTTAVQPWERIGQEAAELLVRRMESSPP